MPLASFLFVLAVEPLAALIRSIENIKGLTFGETVVKISQLADDTTCFVADRESAKLLFQVFEDFRICSGLKCNIDKTALYWLGATKFSEDWDLPVFWKEGNFHTLGISFAENEPEMCKLNFEGKLQSFKEVLKVWRMRDLSLIGKNVVVKNLAVSKLIYPASLIHISDNIIKDVQSMICDFVWSQSTPKVKNSVMYQNLEKGGLKVMHFKTHIYALKLS